VSEGEGRARGTSVCVSIVAESMDRSIRFDSIRFVRTMVSSVAHNRSTRVVSHRARERPSRSAGPRFRKRRALDASERAPDLHASDARRLSRGRWRSAALSQATNRDARHPSRATWLASRAFRVPETRERTLSSQSRCVMIRAAPFYIRKAFATVTPLARLRCARPPADPAPPASPVIAFSIALITDPPVPPQRSTAALPVRPRHKNHDGLLLHRRAPSRLSRPSRGEAQPHGQVRPSPGASPRDRRARESRGLEVHRRLEAPGAFAPELTDERPEASRVGTDFVCRSEGFSRGRSPLTRPSLFDHPTIQPPRTSMQTTR